MNDKTQIEIVQIIDGPAERTSKKGSNYWICKIKDGKTGRVGTSFGAWVKNWKLGDTIEGVWKRGDDWQGQEQWNIENPTPSTSRGGGSRGGGFNMLAHAYMVAATLLAPKFEGNKTDLEKLEKLAKAIKPLIEVAPAPEVAKEEPKVEKTPEPVSRIEETEEEEESLF